MPNPERAPEAPASGLRIAYLTGEYLRLSPFVFIHREPAERRHLALDEDERGESKILAGVVRDA